jgi:NADH:ubiquinone oxidoreductase subunit E
MSTQLENEVASNRETPDLDTVDEIVAQFSDMEGALIPVLQAVQDHYGYIPQEAVYRVAQGLKIYPSSIYGVLTFYTQFNLKPKGKKIVMVCTGTACHVKGSDRIIYRVHDELQLADGEDTTADGNFTVEKVACVGACSIAPVVIMDKQVHGQMNADKTMKNLKKLIEDQDE